MKLKEILEICRHFYEQKPEKAMSFADDVADFLLENKNNPDVINPGFSKLIEPLHSLWATNALPEIVNGRLFMSEAFINSFIGTQIAGHESIKSIDINCYGSGTVDCLVAHSVGRFLIHAELVECVHDQKKSNIVFSIIDKKVMSSEGLVQKLLVSAIMPVFNTFLSKTLNQTMRNGLKLIYGSDVLTIDFADLLKNSALGKYTVDDRSAAYLISIQKATVVDGGIELSLKYNVPD
jgi:hypothetical protein